jgi:hypothetical protein
MTKTFDEICNGILKEMLAAPNPQKPTPAQTPQSNAQPAPNTGAQNAIQSNQNTQNKAKEEEELMKLLQQKLQDEKFKQSLMQLLNPQQTQQPQQNATNQQT